MGKLRSMDREDIVEIRGKGLMIGAETKYPCSKFVDFAREKRRALKLHLGLGAPPGSSA